MKKFLFYRENSQWADGSLNHTVREFMDLYHNLKSTFSDLNFTLNFTKGLKTLSTICLFFLLSGLSINSTFAQQADLRLLTDAYTAGQCPANDIRVLSASIDTGNPCNTCEDGSITVPLTIRIDHGTESGGRHFAICGTIVETLSGGGVVNHNLSMCFGPLLTNSEQIGGGQDLAPVDFTFTCGSSLLITDILLVWTAANGECPVTLANNPNGKYCWDNPDVNIPTAINATADASDAACYGSATGSIDLSVTGGAPSYTYAWTTSNGGVIPAGQADDQDLSGLVAGSYSVTVTDSKGCTDTVSGIVIGQDPETFPDIDKAGSGASPVCGESDPQGTIDTAFAAWLANATADPNDVESNGVVVLNGGAAPYTVTITDPASPDVPQAPPFSGGSTSVTWTITDNCGKQDTVTATFTVTNPCSIICETVPTDVLCYNGTTGSIDVNATLGFPPYSFYLYSSAGFPPADLSTGYLDKVENVNTEPGLATFSNLAAGSYIVLITDATTTLDQASPCPATITQPDAAVSSQISDVDVLCYGAATGSIDLTPSGGTAPYTFAWTASNGGVIPAGQEDDEDLSGLVAGTYDVVITDANGTTGGCADSNQAVISQPDAALSSQISDVDVLCFGAATGSIDLTPSGGTPPYAFAWTASNGGVIPAGQEDDEDLTGLVAGTYDVVITDANGTTEGCGSSNQAVISQPDAALSSQISDVDVLCYGDATGSIDLSPSGGTPPYTFAWTASNGGVIPAGQEDDEDLSGLVAGTYDVVITDANGTTGGCSATNQAVISQPDAALSGSAIPTAESCALNDASVDLSVSGGTPPYSYLWSNGATTEDLIGVGAGSYTVVITDANSCTANAGATVDAPTGCSGDQGCTLGYWKNHVNRWCPEYNRYMLFGSVFVNAPSELAGKNLLEALRARGGGIYNLARQGVAALLNVCSDEVDYPGPYFSNTQALIDAVNAAYLAGGTSPGQLASQLDALNNSGCPLGGTRADSGGGERDANFTAYPVPFQDNITVRYDFDYISKARIEILDLNGVLLMSYDDPDAYLNKEVTLNTNFKRSDVQMFFIKVITDNGVTIKKVTSRK